MGVDSVTHGVFLPTAEFAAAVSGGQGRPVAKPGSFRIISVVRGK
jgi:hypothetical protein